MDIITATFPKFIAGFIASTCLLFTPISDDYVQISTTSELPLIASMSELKEFINSNSKDYDIYSKEGAPLMMNSSVKSLTADTASVESHSETNTQVNGVDEADIIKNDGKYLYHLTSNQLIITTMLPADKMKVMSKINLDCDALELYLDNDKLIVLASSYDKRALSKMLIFDISNISKPTLIRSISISGDYISSRKIGNCVYLVTNEYINRRSNDNDILPCYRDSFSGDELHYIPCNKINYFPDFTSCSYMNTVGIDLSDIKNKTDIHSYLGAGENIYCSIENMYISISKNDYSVSPRTYIWDVDSENTTNTCIYKFGLDKGNISYKASGEVLGTLLNQFSMDESDGYFRIATTSGNIMSTGDNKSQNHMFILDSNMNTIGKINNIAPGEKIYSVRYIGSRAYMVTFRKVDPLFVIDLSNPNNPTILGKLKIPGYSDYLHPYDENHIIGFGLDTDTVSEDEAGTWGWANEGVAAYYQGMKIAIFDVTNPEKPRQKHMEIIGDRGTSSELLYNHKALLFSKEKNLLAFPINVCTIEDKKNADAWTYGDTSFVGAYVYNISLDGGFKLIGELSDLTKEDILKMGYYYDNNKEISRLIYIGDVIYTISDYKYCAYELNSMKKLGEIIIGDEISPSYYDDIIY